MHKQHRNNLYSQELSGFRYLKNLDMFKNLFQTFFFCNAEIILMFFLENTSEAIEFWQSF